MVSWKTVTVPVVLFNLSVRFAHNFSPKGTTNRAAVTVRIVLFNFSVRFAHNFSPKGITNRAALTVCTSESGKYSLNDIRAKRPTGFLIHYPVGLVIQNF